MKKSFAIALLIIMPPMAAFFVTGCGEETVLPVFEVVGQDVEILEEGGFDDVVVEINYDVNRVSELLKASPGSMPGLLFANDPPPNKFKYDFTSIKITADVSFGPSHPAGSDITEFFYFTDHALHETPLNFPFKQLYMFSVYLKMDQSPASHVEAILTIKTSFENGLELTSTTDPITIH